MGLVDFFQIYEEFAPDAERVVLFDWKHIGLLCLTALAAVLLFRFRYRLRKALWKHQVRYWAAGVLFCNMLVFYLLLLLEGNFDWRVHLPFHLCHITGYVMMAVLVLGKERLFPVLYFFAFLGPLPAMLFPNTPTHFSKFYTWNFVISHHLLLLCGLYCLFVLEWKVRVKDLLKAFVSGLTLFGVMTLFNQIFGTNYIMTGELPAHLVRQFPFLSSIGVPFLWLAPAGMAALGIAYLPVTLMRRRDRRFRRLVFQPGWGTIRRSS